MKEALVLAYYFPPIGGAGVQRTVKFARYLPSFGYEPVVVTGSGRTVDTSLGEDATLADDLPSDIRVLRIVSPEPLPPTTGRSRLERWLRLDSDWRKWWIEGLIETGKGETGADVIFATMSPFDSAEAASTLAARLDVPWIADLRDPWALDEMLVWPTVVHRRLERRRMRRSLQTASAVIMNTDEAAAALIQSFPEFESRTHVIPNGYDAADFSGPPPHRDDEAFRIVHAGYLHTAAGRRRMTRRMHGALGGSNAPVDYLTRSHVFLSDAIRGIQNGDPARGAAVELHLVGHQTDADLAESAPFVRTHGYLSHAATIEMIRGADLLFLPMHDLPEGRRARIVPGKTYEYLAAGRPILAAVPDGDARDLLTEAGSAILTRPGDSEAMATAIEETMNRRENGAQLAGDPETIARYERRELTRRLVDVLDRVTSGP